MSVLILRTVLLFLLVTIAMRLMGKRQIGELQPAELVVTLLISELATTPMQQIEEPISAAIFPIVVIVAIEIFISVISMKVPGFRNFVEGNSIIVVENGKPIEKAMKRLRLSINDLTEQLRLNGVFDINKVKYAIIETNGQMSVIQKERYQPPDADTLGVDANDTDHPFLIISDGKLQKQTLEYLKLSKEDIIKALKKKKLKPEEIFMMTSNKNRNYEIIEKNEKEEGKVD